jgi:hypothetical protein
MMGSFTCDRCVLIFRVKAKMSLNIQIYVLR